MQSIKFQALIALQRRNNFFYDRCKISVVIRPNNSSDQLQITTSSLECKCCISHFSSSIQIIILSSMKNVKQNSLFCWTQKHCFMFMAHRSEQKSHLTLWCDLCALRNSFVQFCPFSFVFVSFECFHYMVRHLNVINSRLKLWREIFNLSGKLCDVQCHFAERRKSRRKWNETNNFVILG